MSEQSLKYLQENVEDSNIPVGWYEMEIADMMSDYASTRPISSKAIQLLKVARCPQCDGGGTVVYSQTPEGYADEIGQCQWCFERDEICKPEQEG